MYDQLQRIGEINNVTIFSIFYKLYKPGSLTEQFSPKFSLELLKMVHSSLPQHLTI